MDEKLAQSEPRKSPPAGLTEGRIVHYVMPDGEHRPAIVVRVWDKDMGMVNLTVFPDWRNDSSGTDVNGKQYIMPGTCVNGLLWETSRLYSEGKEPYTWHWIEPA